MSSKTFRNTHRICEKIIFVGRSLKVISPAHLGQKTNLQISLLFVHLSPIHSNNRHVFSLALAFLCLAKHEINKREIDMTGGSAKMAGQLREILYDFNRVSCPFRACLHIACHLKWNCNPQIFFVAKGSASHNVSTFVCNCFAKEDLTLQLTVVNSSWNSLYWNVQGCRFPKCTIRD